MAVEALAFAARCRLPSRGRRRYRRSFADLSLGSAPTPMRWIAPPSKDAATASLETRLWSAADPLRANSGLTAAQYSQPVLGLIFLRFADARFAARASSSKRAPAAAAGRAARTSTSPRP